jgi:hypothetical protein
MNEAADAEAVRAFDTGPFTISAVACTGPCEPPGTNQGQSAIAGADDGQRRSTRVYHNDDGRAEPTKPKSASQETPGREGDIGLASYKDASEASLPFDPILAFALILGERPLSGSAHGDKLVALA